MIARGRPPWHDGALTSDQPIEQAAPLALAIRRGTAAVLAITMLESAPLLRADHVIR